MELLVYREDEEQSVEEANQAVMDHCKKWLRHRHKHKRFYPDNGDGKSSSKILLRSQHAWCEV
jgi:hypothetical protein